MKIIETNIIVHVPCCNIEKKRTIKSAIQKFLSGFILKHSEKQTKKPANTNIKRQQTAPKTTMFYVKRPFCQEKRHFLIQTIKECPAFQA